MIARVAAYWLVDSIQKRAEFPRLKGHLYDLVPPAQKRIFRSSSRRDRRSASVASRMSVNGESWDAIEVPQVASHDLITARKRGARDHEI